jgi:hypothetical protein
MADSSYTKFELLHIPCVAKVRDIVYICNIILFCLKVKIFV